MSDKTLLAGRFVFLELAHAMLTADARIAGWARPDLVERVLDFRNRGWRLGLELFAEESGGTTVSLIAVSPDGQREMVDSVGDGPRGATN